MKRNTKISLIIFAIILIFLAIFAVFYQTGIINKIAIGEQKAEVKKEISYEVYHHVDGNTKILVIVEDTENGIEKVIYPNNEMELYCDGKNKVAFDYHVDITDKESITFTAINTKGETLENTILINDEFYNKLIDSQLVNETETQKALTINYKTGSVTKQYKIGDLGSWINYTNTIRLDYHQILEVLGDENENLDISLREVDNLGNEIIIKKKLALNSTLKYKKEDTVIEGESILACVENNNLQTGNYIFKVTGTTDGTTQETKEYPVELYNYNDDANYITNSIAVVNGISYTGFGHISSEKRMLILKYNGNLTINSGVEITPTGTNISINGATYLCTKKGMLIYCAGTLTNNGTISMTGKGTVNQAGENVYLYKNTDNSYEYIPAIGASGGASVSGLTRGRAGNAGTSRRTGGGGSGGVSNIRATSVSGKGGTGTSYSGGAGGGGSNAGYSALYGEAGSDIGGKGGNGKSKNTGAGGGAGNPGGSGAANGGSSTWGRGGSRGTGGLLILNANTIINNGTITSNGANGGYGDSAGGGGSGGGSINLFYKSNIKTGNVIANAGARGNSHGGNNYIDVGGGAGGAGCVTVTKISK